MDASSEPVGFAATVESYEPTLGTTSDGTDYVCLRGATVVTEFETIERTVMAFGEPARTLAAVLADRGDAPVVLQVRQAGPILKVVGERRAA